MNARAWISRSACIVALAAVSAVALAQEPRRMGILYTGSQSRIASEERILIETLRDKGFVEGRNLMVTRRYAEGDMKRLDAYAGEMSAMKPDVVVTMCTPSTRAMSAASSDIPIVMGMISDPVGQRLIASLAHPGNNITGSANLYEEALSKMFEVLARILPTGARVAVLANKANVAHHRLWPIATEATQKLQLTLRRYEVTDPAGIPRLLESMLTELPQAIFVLPDDPVLSNQRATVIEFAARNRLPTMYSAREFAEDGGLMSYGTSFSEAYREAGAYVARILAGAKPADLPVSQPTMFELTINMKTARAIGIVIPDELLLRAEKVLE